MKRVRSTKDKREIVIQLVDSPNSLFMKQHKKTLEYVEKIVGQLGEKTDEVVNIFEMIAKIAQEENI